MAVGQDAIGSRGDSSGGTTWTCSVTVSGSNSNRALFVTITWETSGPLTVSSVATNQNGGATLTQVGAGAAVSQYGTAIYRLINPDAATHTITVTMSGSIVNRGHAVAYSLYDVDQTTPAENYTNTTASNALTVTCPTDDYSLLCICGNANPTSISPGTTDTATTAIAHAHHISTGSSVAYTWSGPSVRTASGCSVKSAAAAATGHPTMRRWGGTPGMTPQSFGRGW